MSSHNANSSPIPKVYKMSGMKSLVGKRNEKKIQFMDQEMSISKLSLADVTKIQDMSKAGENDEKLGLDVIRTVIRLSAEGAADLTDEDMNTFPLDDLNSLSKQIMEFSGIGNQPAGE